MIFDTLGILEPAATSISVQAEDHEERSLGITPTPISGMSNSGTNILFQTSSDTGIVVNEFTAMSSPAVYAAITLISDTIGYLDPVVWARQEKGKSRLPDHAVKNVIDYPNDTMTGFTFRNLLTSHVLGWGNGYAFIEYDDQMNPTGLLPLLPDRTYAWRLPTGELVYFTRVNGVQITLSPFQVFHLSGFSFNGLNGFSPIQLFRQSIGLNLAYDQFGAKFFGGGLHSSGILSHPGQLSADAQERLRDQVTKKLTGIENAHKVMILEESMKFEKLSIDPDSAQYIESKKFSVKEIARIFRTPPHMIGDLEQATNNNIEQQGLDFKTNCLNPWLKRWEDEINRKLISLSERSQTFVKFDLTNLLRADSAARSTYYKNMAGILMIDEIREAEDMNPLPEDQGQEILVPGGYTTLSQLLTPAIVSSPAPVAASGAPADENVSDSASVDIDPANAPAGASVDIDPVAADTTINDDTRSLEKRATLDNQFMPLFRYAASSKLDASQLRQVISPFVAAVRALAEAEAGTSAAGEQRGADTFDKWVGTYCDYASTRMSKSDDPAETQAPYEARRCRSAVTREVYQEKGVKNIRWINGTLHGQSAEIGTGFSHEGRQYMHPPLNSSCTGEIMPMMGETK